MSKSDCFIRKFFEIKDYNDVYCAVGKIIQAAQEWEQHYKNCADVLGLQLKNLQTATLNKINKNLLQTKKINDKDFKNLKFVIDKRNYINHEFFLKPLKHFNLVEDELNEILFYIFEATDVVSNLIGRKNKAYPIPTTFDEN